MTTIMIMIIIPGEFVVMVVVVLLQLVVFHWSLSLSDSKSHLVSESWPILIIL